MQTWLWMAHSIQFSSIHTNPYNGFNIQKKNSIFQKTINNLGMINLTMPVVYVFDIRYIKQTVVHTGELVKSDLNVNA